MAEQVWDTLILGAGPVGLVTALAAARSGRVLVMAPRIPQNTQALRIDSVPLALLALFVEFGLHPSEINAGETHDHRLAAWESKTPSLIRGAATVHLERPLLEQSLIALARRHPAITIWLGDLPDRWPKTKLYLDATGRRAVSAEWKLAPDNPSICRTFVMSGEGFSKSQQAFRIAALPTGYAYRMGTCGSLVLGIVQGRNEWACPIGDLTSYLRQFDADWLFAGIASDRFMPAMGGHSSFQWTMGQPAPVRIGDAAFARDALAAQGIANGISGGLKAIAGALSMENWQRQLKAEALGHLENLRNIIAGCRYADRPYWSNYACALGNIEKQIGEA
jgi:hypothetical protein